MTKEITNKLPGNPISFDQKISKAKKGSVELILEAVKDILNKILEALTNGG